MALASPEEQYLLELINEARMDPMGNAARYIASYSPLKSTDSQIQDAITYFKVDGKALLSAYEGLDPVRPLAWNSVLGDTALFHNQAMIRADAQAHQVDGEDDLGTRIKAQGYAYKILGENIYAYSYNALYAHAGFMIDWGNGPNGMQSPAGHRDNIMSKAFTEIGISITSESNTKTSVGPQVVTQDFGDRGKIYLMGVAYEDRDHNNFYSPGEGVGELMIRSDARWTMSTSSGGYSLFIDPGVQKFSISGGGIEGEVYVSMTIRENAKLDVVNGDTLLSTNSLTLTDYAGYITTVKALGAYTDGVVFKTGSGVQTLIGGLGGDTLDAGDGDDFFHAGQGNDTVIGGAGTDTAILDGKKSEYTATRVDSGTIRLSSTREGSDTYESVERFKFTDGEFTWDFRQNKFVEYVVNRAPTAQAEQSVQIEEGVAAQISVQASDEDGDALSFKAGTAAHGTVSGGANGVFTYTPNANYVGSDSFSVTITDGNGGTASQTVNLLIADVNHAPVVPALKNVTAVEGTPAQVTVTATDPDGDALTYTAGKAAHGVVTGGAKGVFTYTPNAGYTGNDTFIVGVSDGHGGSASQTVAIAVQSETAPPPPVQSIPETHGTFRFFAGDGFVGSVGGSGKVFGTNGVQDLTMVGKTDSIVFDSTFSRGSDIIRLSGNAHDYSIRLDGVDAIISKGALIYTLPVGSNGAFIVFADGAREIAFDEASGKVKIGSQAISEVVSAITAPADGSELPNDADADAVGRTFLQNGARVAVAGDHEVFGSGKADVVKYLSGDVHLDPSFSRGDDAILFDKPASAYKAYLEGAELVITSNDGALHLPVGSTGVTLNFAGTSYVVWFDADSGNVLLGNLEITAADAAGAHALSGLTGGTSGGGGDETLSIDVGNGGTVVEINLDDGVAYNLQDLVSKDTNVVIRGFDGDDMIAVTGATASDYNFGWNDYDKDSVADDLIISFSDGKTFTSIAILDVVPQDAGWISSYGSAAAAIGHEFMTFG